MHGVTLPAAVARSEVTFADTDAININNNNKMVFPAEYCVLIKLLRQERWYGAKTFIAEFSIKPWTLSGLYKRLLYTGHFTFRAILQKPL